jgi:dTDP-glucose pyrophosphorylase
MIQIVVPMAGRGSRFANAGYTDPKPFIKIHQKSLIECVAKNITPKCAHQFTYICSQEHFAKYDLKGLLQNITPGCNIITVDKITEGAACTVLLAKEYFDNDDMLMIANSDQYVDIDIDQYIQAIGDYDGLIMTMKATEAKWSYIRYDTHKNVEIVREKEVISDEATVGIYNFRRGADFVKYANQMIDKNIRVNDEFYVAPVYNEMIEAGKKITFHNIGADKCGMYGLGVPEDLEYFKKLKLSEFF